MFKNIHAFAQVCVYAFMCLTRLQPGSDVLRELLLCKLACSVLTLPCCHHARQADNTEKDCTLIEVCVCLSACVLVCLSMCACVFESVLISIRGYFGQTTLGCLSPTSMANIQTLQGFSEIVNVCVHGRLIH